MKVPFGILKFLSDDEIIQIHKVALRILSQIGVKVLSPRMRKSLSEYGAKIENNEIVKIPEQVVNKAVEQCPSEVVLKGRATEMLRIGGDNHFHFGCVQAPFLFDYKTQKLRSFELSDLIKNVKIVDSLPGYAGIGLTDGEFGDTPAETASLKAAEAFFSFSTKPASIAINNVPLTRIWLDMADIAVGGEGLKKTPTIVFAVSTTTPLMIEPDSAESLFDVIERGAPVLTLPCPMGGGTSPYSLAGTLTMHTAENLFIITTCQAIQQGHPVIYGGVPSTMDMRTGNVSYGNPELPMMFAGMAQVANYFGLPAYAPIALTDSKEPDMQAGYEKMRAFLLAGLGGLNLTQCSGLSAAAMSMVTEQLVIEHEILCSVERIFQGISVNDKSIGWDAIKRVGIGGHFLRDDHTMSFLGTQEHFENKVADRSSLGGSGKNICEKACAVASKLEAEHKSRVEDKVVVELKKYVEKYIRQK